MMHASLRETITLPNGAGHYLGVYQGAAAGQLNVVKYLPFVQLECTVDIPYIHTEQQTDQLCPTPAVDFSNDVVLPVEPVTAYYIVFIHQFEQRRHFTDIKLSVAIRVEDESLACCGKTGGAGLSRNRDWADDAPP